MAESLQILTKFNGWGVTNPQLVFVVWVVIFDFPYVEDKRIVIFDFPYVEAKRIVIIDFPIIIKNLSSTILTQTLPLTQTLTNSHSVLWLRRNKSSLSFMAVALKILTQFYCWGVTNPYSVLWLRRYKSSLSFMAEASQILSQCFD